MDSIFHGSRGEIRTRDQLINSQLRYRCATREYSTYFSAFTRLCKLAERFYSLGNVSNISPRATVTQYDQHIRAFWRVDNRRVV